MEPDITLLLVMGKPPVPNIQMAAKGWQQKNR
jgi:hypothetical protein